MNKPDNPDDALQRLVGDYADMLFRIALVHLKNWHDAEDVVQRVFIELYETWPDFASEEHRKAWLIRVTIHRCKDCQKSAWKQRSVPLNEDVLGIDFEISDITRAVLKLSAKDRQVILLQAYLGYTIREIAAITGQTPPAVATRLHRARKKLKRDIDFPDL